MSSEDIKVGSRFVYEGNIGTVRYIGNVPPTEGIWLGVEWDDESRGKHDGSHDGCQYFQTSYPRSGSFLRPNKADFGINCLHAISERYGKMKSSLDNAKSNEEKLFIVMKNKGILPIEAVGYDKIEAKQSKLSNLLDVCISQTKVSAAGAEHELATVVPNIINLDLSHNLLSSWDEVARITKQLQHLESLNLSNNRLTLPNDHGMLKSAFATLRIIILIKMNYTWEQVLWCSKMWFQITHLQVPFNKISTLEMSTDALLNLEHLDLEGNLVNNWSEVTKLGHLPKLKFINLNNNGIKDIAFSDVLPDGKTQLFLALEVLYLQDNSIGQWCAINELNKLPSLIEIAIRKNPLWELEKPSTVWQLLIAKLSSLRILNRSSIPADERRGAELDYLAKYGKEWLAVEICSQSSVRDEFLRNHPRYPHLVKVHGAPEESEVNVQSPSLKNSLMTLSIYCPQLLDSKPIVKKFPGSMTVQKLRNLVHRLFKLEMQNVILYCSSTKRPNHEVELDNDLRLLSFYAENEDQILVKWR